MTRTYVHGYTAQENCRLADQAATLEEMLHSDTHYPPGAQVLEAGCGVGAQTVPLALNSPEAAFTCMDISRSSLDQARVKAREAGAGNVRFLRGDIFEPPFPAESFDHVFVCFVLEHLPDPTGALIKLKDLLKPGGTLTLIEGDHGSTYFHPESSAARAAIRCQVELQKAAGGNANIGRQVYPLLKEAGLREINVSPCMVHATGNRPELQDGFTRKTFTAMIRGVRENALQAGLTTPEDFDRGINDLLRTAQPDGVFCYTFFKGVGRKP